MVLDVSLLNTLYYNVRIKRKVEQSTERSSAPPTPWFRGYRIGSHRVNLDSGRQIYLLNLCQRGCTKRRRENVVVVWPTYVIAVMLFSEKHSRNGYVNLNTTLVWFKKVWGEFVLFLMMRFDVYLTNNLTHAPRMTSAWASMGYFLHYLDQTWKK